MNTPLSNSIGNALEVEEAMRVLKGAECKLADVSKEIATILIALAKKISNTEALEMVEEVLNNKKAYKKFKEFVRFQNGDLSKFDIKANIKVIRSPEAGILKNINARKEYRLKINMCLIFLALTYRFI
jgi:thymidine phosphorylase